MLRRVIGDRHRLASRNDVLSKLLGGSCLAGLTCRHFTGLYLLQGIGSYRKIGKCQLAVCIGDAILGHVDPAVGSSV